MKNVFDKFIQEINYEKTPSFNEVKIEKANIIDQEIFEIAFNSPHIIPFNEMEGFLQKLNTFKYKVKFNFDVLSIIYKHEDVKRYIDWIIAQYFKNPLLSKQFVNSIQEISNEGNILLSINNDYLFEKAKAIKDDLTRIMQKFGYQNINFVIEITGNDFLQEAKDKIIDEYKKIDINQIKKTAPETKSYKHGYINHTLKELYETHNYKVITKGKIVGVDTFKTKTGMTIFTFNLTDYSEAIYLKAFASTDKQLENFNHFNEGDYISVQGNLQLDTFSKQKTINVTKMKKIGSLDSSKIDEEETKRVELGFRSRMSTMDGIKSAKEIVNYIKKINHNAVAIVDHNSVQSFPEFYQAAKENGVKAIYGATINTISKHNNAIINMQDNKSLIEDEYVVFDLETTGLSPIFNEIIEFGAVIIKNNQIVDRMQFFIKPEKPIPAYITKITKIDENHVKDAISQKEGIKKIIDYIGVKTLVAHNAAFDYAFLQSKANKFLNFNIDNTIIDSLETSRIVFPNNKRFRLETVAKKYDVVYDSTISHRADYDAEVLANIWIKQIYDLKEISLTDQKTLKSFTSASLYKKQFPFDVSVLAKNQAGLKELFSILSHTLTNNMFKAGEYFMEDFANRKNILIGTSALKGKLVDLMLTGTKQQIIDEIKKYDYIEVQPPKNFKHIIDERLSLQELESIIKFVIEEAKKLGKIVIATGDVRYFDINEKIYHEIYINAKGLGGVRHYLYKYDKESRNYPTQNFLITSEMKKEFSFLEDINLIEEIVVKNSNYISDSIEEIEVIKTELYTPEMEEVDEKLEQVVFQNAIKKYGHKGVLPQEVEKRLKKELEPIKKYGFSVIYWISHLLVEKSLKDGYLVGSRGSVGSSLVATMANITEVNPLEPHYVCGECKWSLFLKDNNLNSGYDLEEKKCPNCNISLKREGQKIPFETFLGFEANKVPDIDLNFSGDYQSTIHNEVKKIFGETHSFRAGTISTVAEKTAFGYVKAWAEENDIVVSKAFIEFLAKAVAGTKRTTGQHPGGIIVIPKKMHVEDFTPINFPANDGESSWKTTHFDFHAIHDNVLKLDLLGHDDPTAIKNLEKLTGVNAKTIPFNDVKIISLFSSPKELGVKPEDINNEKTGVMGIPEFGTSFVRRMLQTAKVKSFGDLISVSGLSHGTDVWSGNAEMLVKENKQLSEVISCRDNIMTDLIAKKLDSSIAFEIMEKVRKGNGLTENQEKLLKENGVEDWYINSLKKIKYMFPKAHATAYVMMAWRIAWFKLYHARAYYATYFTTRADVFDIETVIGGKQATMERLQNLRKRRNARGPDQLSNKEKALIPILEIANEAFARNIKISNIDIYKSQAKEWSIDAESQTLIPPFVSLDGLGEAVAMSVVAARETNPFTSIEDIQTRTSLNKTILQKMKDLDILKGISEKNQISISDFIV